MKIKYFNYFFFLIILLGNACSPKPSQIIEKTDTLQKKDEIHLSFKQGKNEFFVKERNEIIYLKKAPFTIYFNNKEYNWDNKKPYAAQIAITNKIENKKWFVEGNIADYDNVNLFLSAGTGMASSENNQYEKMYVEDDNGHHYLTYDTQEKINRATLVKNLGNGMHRLKWDIDTYKFKHKEHPMKEMKFDVLYLMFFIDKNLNKIVEKGEYHVVDIHFK